MKIEIRKIEPYMDAYGDWNEQEWDWVFRADNGAPIGQSMHSYRRRADAIRGALLVTGLALPERPKGCKNQHRSGYTMTRMGLADVYVDYGAGGQIKYAQWSCDNLEFVELVEAS
jgi:uncharacterized protein YegP (UPF0339 family)